MAQKTDEELLIEASVIKNETAAGANTANRVGTMLEDIIDSKVNTQNVNSNTFIVDLSEGDYTMTSEGIYEFYNCVGNVVNFPDPNDYHGKTIVLINTDLSNSINLNYNAPLWIGSTTPMTVIGTGRMMYFVSINMNWRGGFLND